jgi:hypothetical protein
MHVLGSLADVNYAWFLLQNEKLIRVDKSFLSLFPCLHHKGSVVILTMRAQSLVLSSFTAGG